MAELARFFPFILLIVFFYFFLIRPQTQQQKKRKELLQSVKEGDKIRTIGGFYGTVEKIREEDLTVRIADNVRVRLARFAVESIVDSKEEK